ncbi:MAG: FAD-dependent oxidoreductase [Hyphomicrobiaceae bacterium]
MNQHIALVGDEIAPEYAPSIAGALPSPERTAPIVIIGGGPVGIRAAQELSRLGRDCIVLNAERWLPYNRVKLSTLLAGDVQIGQVMQPLGFPGPGRVLLYSDQSVVDVDRSARNVTISSGRKFDYSSLVFCTGSRAHVPPIPGRERAGVFTFRSADDVEKLTARALRSRRTVVVGGGLLGLEAARGMSNRGIETWVVEHSPHLMPRQLDGRAGRSLADSIERMGVHVRTNASVASIDGTDRVEGITLKDGSQLPCDTVIICTGIRANIELAREIGLPVGLGIKVDAQMRTSDPHIYAAGECAEFDGNVYGVIGPGFEQALVAASHIAGQARIYGGSVASTKLKVVGVDVFSMGDVEQIDQRSDVRRLSFEDADAGIYRCIVLKRSRLVGAMAVGDWPEINRIQQAVGAETILYPWDLFRFRRTGRVWPARAPTSVRDWPRMATVCNCTGVTRGQIGDAIALGAGTLDDVKRDTGASTVCGSCRVNIEQLLGAPAKREPVPKRGLLLALSGIAALLATIVLLLPRFPLAGSIADVGLPERLWLDGYWKQVSGYTLLALAVIAAVLSLRKRVKPFRIGNYDVWRIVHAAVGAGAVIALAAHSGFRLGANLNFWLIASFLLLMLSGAATALVTANEHRLDQEPAVRLKSIGFWLHLIAFWPLPLLLAVHVLSVYFY